MSHWWFDHSGGKSESESSRLFTKYDKFRLGHLGTASTIMMSPTEFQVNGNSSLFTYAD